MWLANHQYIAFAEIAPQGNDNNQIYSIAALDFIESAHIPIRPGKKGAVNICVATMLSDRIHRLVVQQGYIDGPLGIFANTISPAMRIRIIVFTKVGERDGYL
jgi:hypothetical protein